MRLNPHILPFLSASALAEREGSRTGRAWPRGKPVPAESALTGASAGFLCPGQLHDGGAQPSGNGDFFQRPQATSRSTQDNARKVRTGPGNRNRHPGFYSGRRRQRRNAGFPAFQPVQPGSGKILRKFLRSLFRVKSFRIQMNGCLAQLHFYPRKGQVTKPGDGFFYGISFHSQILHPCRRISIHCSRAHSSRRGRTEFLHPEQRAHPVILEPRPLLPYGTGTFQVKQHPVHRHIRQIINGGSPGLQETMCPRGTTGSTAFVPVLAPLHAAG